MFTVVKKNVAEKLIFTQNVHTINVGLKCIETVKKSSTKDKHLKTVQASPQRYLNKYEEHSETFIGNYSGITFCKYLHVEQVLIVHCRYTSSTLNHIPSCKLDKSFPCEKYSESEDNVNF